MHFGKNVKKIRKQKGITLQKLSQLSEVSPSMLSKIEREEKNPTIQVACQIAEGLNITLSDLLDQKERKKDRMVLKKETRQIYIDKKFGFERHLLSPSAPSSGIEFILNKIPPKSESGIFPAHKEGVTETIYVAKGCITVELDGGDFKENLNEGDSFYFEANTEHRFINKTDEESHYYLVIHSTIK
ncbi:XRE family transcriptional regulator [Bacillus carboniphilus]|uniref:XRE family transcriptional regulator n=1 Tax=Bacillus carboniphilus TaxID=86663 RepID=A0ABY9JUZ8_9BACI|nr:XRE family transcriptional regulator [Bacillus carboniphilus]WLR43234.1 XRE family transcriptional regulator [Bacillus carboniphilus]